MAGVNKVIIVGRLGANPEVRYTANGQAVGRLNIATSEQWNDKASGQKQERTEWHRVVVWGKMAEICNQHLTKGRQVYVEGRLQTRSWDDKNTGQKRYSTEINASTVQFLGSASEGAGSNANAGGGDFANQGAPQVADSNFSPEPAFNSEEDIPF